MILATTGHRPHKLGGYTFDVVERLRIVAMNYLYRCQLQLNAFDTIEVITGMALGWDTTVAEAAIERGIPFCAAVPCDNQEKVWPWQSQLQYRALLAKAKTIYVVSPGHYEPWKMQARNEWMVDHCDRLVALWDGTRGGTYNCIDYAARQKPPVPTVNLWKEFSP